MNRKHFFRDVSGEELLARLRELPVQTWSYRVEDDDIRHLGPTAQDFHAAFGLGGDSTSIGTVDADGVALVGIQTLDRRSMVQDDRIMALEAENADLRARIERMEAQLARLVGTVEDDAGEAILSRR